MKKTIIFLYILLAIFVCQPNAMATAYVQTSTSLKGLYPAIAAKGDHELFVYEWQETRLYQHEWKRGSQGWSSKKTTEYDLSSIFSPSTTIVNQWVNDSGRTLLVTELSCDSSVCSPVADTVLQYGDNSGWVVLARNALSCASYSTPHLIKNKNQITYINACDNFFKLSADGLQPIEKLLVEHPDGDELAIFIHQSKISIESTHTGNADIDVPEKIRYCELLMSKENKALSCRGQLKNYTVLFDGKAWLLTVNDLDFEQSMQINNGHVYSLNYSGENVSVLNTAWSASFDIYSKRNVSSRVRQTTNKAWQWQSTPLWTVSPSGFYSVIPLFINSNRIDFLWFDATPINFPPQALRTDFSMYSGIESREPAFLYDEDSLPQELNWSSAQQPNWAVFEKNKNEWIFNPTHKDVSSLVVLGSVSDPNGSSSNVELMFNVVLMPHQLNVYEKNWFELWKIEKPIPFKELISQVKKIPVNEDSETIWEFSVSNRDVSEVSFDVQEKPSFVNISHDGLNLKLTMNASQKEIGEHSLKLTIHDNYQSDDVISIPIFVIENDEPFTILSTPALKTVTNKVYSYTLETTDEETAAKDMHVTIISSPPFLKWDPQTAQLTGMPERKDVGNYPVAIQISDDAGHRVVQQWTLVVEIDPETDVSGGSFGLFMLFFLFLVKYFRFFEKKYLL